MKRILVPIAIVVASVLLYPSGAGLFSQWERLPTLESTHEEGSGRRSLDSLRSAWRSISGRDTSMRTEVVVDPFRATSVAPEVVSHIRPSTDFGPPPPRLWKATGRVGERAAVLSHPDGRVLVVSVGQALDSATVVGIGPGGVDLEDRGGKFTLRIP